MDIRTHNLIIVQIRLPASGKNLCIVLNPGSISIFNRRQNTNTVVRFIKEWKSDFTAVTNKIALFRRKAVKIKNRLIKFGLPLTAFCIYFFFGSAIEMKNILFLRMIIPEFVDD